MTKFHLGLMLLVVVAASLRAQPSVNLSIDTNPSPRWLLFSAGVSVDGGEGQQLSAYVSRNGAMIASGSGETSIWVGTPTQANGQTEYSGCGSWYDNNTGLQEEWRFETALVGVAADYQPPTTPTSLVASNATPTSFTLSWAASTDNTALKEYFIRRDFNPTNWDGSTTTTTFNAPGYTGAIQADIPYRYEVCARDVYGNTSPWSEVLIVTLYPPSPAIRIQPVSQMANDIGASVSFVALASGYPAPGYQWKKDGVNINGATNATFTIPSVQTSDVANYFVTATNSVGSADSLAVALTIDTRPTTPATLNYAEKTHSSVTLLWSASTDNVGVVGYNVYRDGVELIGTTSDCVFVDSNRSAGTTYTYTVKALDGSGKLSDPSPQLSVTTNASPTADDDNDRLPNLVEVALGTTATTTTGDSNNQTTQQKIHRPIQ